MGDRTDQGRRQAGSLLAFARAEKPAPFPRAEPAAAPKPAPVRNVSAEAPLRPKPQPAVPPEPPVVPSTPPVAPTEAGWSLRDLWPRRAEPPAPAPEPVEPEAGSDIAAADADDGAWRPLVDPVAVARGVARARLLILLLTLLGAAIGIGVALSIPKKYQAYSELLIDPRDLKMVDRDLTQSGLPSDATLAIVENQVRVLTSRSVLNKVVDELNLTSDPEFNGQAASLDLNPVSLLRAILTRPGPREAETRRELALRNLARSLSVERGGKTFVVVIAATTTNPEKSALVANTVTDVFLNTYGEIQSGTAGRAADELTGRLDELRAGVEAAERKVEAYRAEHDLVDAQGRLISQDELVKLNDQLSVARARTIELNARAASARDLDVDQVIGGTLPEQVNSSLMTELRSQYATLQQETDRMAIRLGPRHPTRQAAEAQLAGARAQIRAELSRIVSSIQVELKRAVQLEQDLAARLAQIKVRQGGVSEDLVTLRELEREAAAKRAVYESFLLRARETGEQRDLNTANMSVISRAFPPLESVGPSRSTIAMAGAALGFCAGVVLGAAGGAWEGMRRRPAARSRPSAVRRPAPPPVAVPDAPPVAAAVPVPAAVPPSPPAPVRTVAQSPADPGADSGIDDIRAELRAFREALAELSESRSRRRS